MKAAVVALVVLAAVLGAQATPADDFTGVAVVESALKGLGNLPRCLVGIPSTLITEVANLAQVCFSSVQAVPICMIGAVQQVLQDVYIEFSQCLSS